ncbi:MAG: hypothetical protein Q8Q49_01195 [bacterium]|nr:hypothetical protein [bacterium]
MATRSTEVLTSGQNHTNGDGDFNSGSGQTDEASFGNLVTLRLIPNGSVPAQIAADPIRLEAFSLGFQASKQLHEQAKPHDVSSTPLDTQKSLLTTGTIGLGKTLARGARRTHTAIAGIDLRVGKRVEPTMTVFRSAVDLPKITITTIQRHREETEKKRIAAREEAAARRKLSLREIRLLELDNGNPNFLAAMQKLADGDGITLTLEGLLSDTPPREAQTEKRSLFVNVQLPLRRRKRRIDFSERNSPYSMIPPEELGVAPHTREVLHIDPQNKQHTAETRKKRRGKSALQPVARHDNDPAGMLTRRLFLGGTISTAALSFATFLGMKYQENETDIPQTPKKYQIFSNGSIIESPTNEHPPMKVDGCRVRIDKKSYSKFLSSIRLGKYTTIMLHDPLDAQSPGTSLSTLNGSPFNQENIYEDGDDIVLMGLPGSNDFLELTWVTREVGGKIIDGSASYIPTQKLDYFTDVDGPKISSEFPLSPEQLDSPYQIAKIFYDAGLDTDIMVHSFRTDCQLVYFDTASKKVKIAVSEELLRNPSFPQELEMRLFYELTKTYFDYLLQFGSTEFVNDSADIAVRLVQGHEEMLTKAKNQSYISTSMAAGLSLSEHPFFAISNPQAYIPEFFRNDPKKTDGPIQNARTQFAGTLTVLRFLPEMLAQRYQSLRELEIAKTNNSEHIPSDIYIYLKTAMSALMNRDKIYAIEGVTPFIPLEAQKILEDFGIGGIFYPDNYNTGNSIPGGN